MKDKISPKAAVAIAVVAVAIAGYVGMNALGGPPNAAGGGAGETYTAPATGIDMERLNASPNLPEGMASAGGTDQAAPQ